MVTACLLIVNLLFKRKVMKAEQLAIGSGRGDR